MEQDYPTLALLLSLELIEGSVRELSSAATRAERPVLVRIETLLGGLDRQWPDLAAAMEIEARALANQGTFFRSSRHIEEWAAEAELNWRTVEVVRQAETRWVEAREAIVTRTLAFGRLTADDLVQIAGVWLQRRLQVRRLHAQLLARLGCGPLDPAWPADPFTRRPVEP